MPPPSEPYNALIDDLADVIAAFNGKKAAILKKAFDEGGDEQVNEVLDLLRDLRDARFELLQRTLDSKNDAFVKLAGDAKNATKALKKSITSLGKVANVVQKAAAVIDLVGRILIRFGI